MMEKTNKLLANIEREYNIQRQLEVVAKQQGEYHTRNIHKYIAESLKRILNGPNK